MNCDRCEKETSSTIMSMMNLDTICYECKEEEVKHPSYVEAREKEVEEVLAKNYNYPGLFAGKKWPFVEKESE